MSSRSSKRKLGWVEPENHSLLTPIVSRKALEDTSHARKETSDGFIAFDDDFSSGGCSLTQPSLNGLKSHPGVDPEIAPFVHNLPSVLAPNKKRRQCGILKQFATPRFWVREVDKSCLHHEFTVEQYRKLWKYAVSQVDVEKELYIEVMRKQHPGLGDEKLWELVRQELPSVLNKIYDPKVATPDDRHRLVQRQHNERLKRSMVNGNEALTTKLLEKGNKKGFDQSHAVTAAAQTKNEIVNQSMAKLVKAEGPSTRREELHKTQEMLSQAGERVAKRIKNEYDDDQSEKRIKNEYDDDQSEKRIKKEYDDDQSEKRIKKEYDDDQSEKRIKNECDDGQSENHIIGNCRLYIGNLPFTVTEET